MIQRNPDIIAKIADEIADISGIKDKVKQLTMVSYNIVLTLLGIIKA